jgi:hypothetical protein
LHNIVAREACSVASCSARLFSHEASVPPRHVFHRRRAQCFCSSA